VSNIDPQYEAAGFTGPIVGYEPWGASTYHGLQTQLDRRFANGLYLQAAYTFSHAIDNSTADFFSTVIAPRRPQDFRNLPAERSNSVLDHRNRFSLSMVYDTQWFKHSSSWIARNVLSGYEIAPTYIYETGQWATVQSGQDSNLNGDNAGDRAIFNAGGVAGRGTDVLPITDQSNNCGVLEDEPCIVGYVANDPTARYIRTGIGALATTGRNTLSSPAINNWDLTVAKTIHFNERVSFKFQFQALNALNHPEFTTGLVNQANSFSSAGSGQRNVLRPEKSTFNDWRSAFSSNSRIVQLGAKLIF